MFDRKCTNGWVMNAVSPPRVLVPSLCTRIRLAGVGVRAQHTQSIAIERPFIVE